MIVPPDRWRANLRSLQKHKRWRAVRSFWAGLRQYKLALRLSQLMKRLRAAYRRFRLPALAFVCWLAVVLTFILSPWPPLTTLRHIVSAPNCASARLVGLAPAREGEPGYWPWLDRDNDGLACEVWPPPQKRQQRDGSNNEDDDHRP